MFIVFIILCGLLLIVYLMYSTSSNDDFKPSEYTTSKIQVEISVKPDLNPYFDYSHNEPHWIKKEDIDFKKVKGFALAGFSHYQSGIIDLINGQEVALEPEPYNEHDPNAIMVHNHNRCIGYIPEGMNINILDAWTKDKQPRAYVEFVMDGYYKKVYLMIIWD